MCPVNSIIIEGNICSKDITKFTSDNCRMVDLILMYKSTKINPNGTVEVQEFEVPCMCTSIILDNANCNTKGCIKVRIVGRLAQNLFKQSGNYGDICIVVEHIEKLATA